MAVSKETMLKLLQGMLLTRKMEEKHAGLINGDSYIALAHFGTGMEAVGVGAMSALRKEDVMIGCHRGFAEYIGKGMDPLDIWAEYLGKKRILNGKAGIQISDKTNNIPGMTACIGGGYAIAVGMAYAIKKNNENRIVVVSYGDGGYNQSDVHPAMVIAASLKLPVLFHVANNGWAEYTRSSEFTPTENLSARGAAYNIPSRSVDGQRADIVYQAAQEAVEHVRSGKGPYFMEYMTLRLGPHFQGDPGGYYDEAEMLELAKRDPIKLFREMFIEKGIMTGDDFEGYEAQAQNIAEETFNAARKLPDADESDLFTNVFA